MCSIGPDLDAGIGLASIAEDPICRALISVPSLRANVSSNPQLSDKSLAVFAFALYHHFQSGSRVTEIIKEDGAGHRADPEALDELNRLGLVIANDNRVSFTDRGEAVLDRLITLMRQPAGQHP